MPTFKNFVDFHFLRGVRAFLNLEAGVIRGIPPERQREQAALKKEREISRLRKKLAETNIELDQLTADGRGRDGSDDDVPMFFLIGLPKSGTTWLMRMLNQHRDVLCWGEGRFFGRNDRNETFEKAKINSTGHLLRPASLYNTLAESEYLRLWIERTFWSKDSDVEEHIVRLTREAVRYFLIQKLAESGKKVVGDKTPLPEATIVKEIAKILPEARIIHIIRDGRDQAVSHAHHRWNRVRPVEEGGRLTPEERGKRDRYRENPERFLASGESIFSEQRIVAAAKGWKSNVGHTHREGSALFGDRYAEVRYEDLLERPEKELSRLFRFLGASDDEAIVRQCIERNRFEKRAQRAAGQEDSSSFLRKGVAGDWKSVFTERDRQVFKEFAGDLLVELGYEESLDW
ncbi:MAG: sulfotransferase [Rubrobacteraceae bacterium]